MDTAIIAKLDEILALIGGEWTSVSFSVYREPTATTYSQTLNSPTQTLSTNDRRVNP